MESSCVRSGCGHAWTPRRDFAVSKSVTQSLTIGCVAFQKAGAQRVALRADPVRARPGPTGRSGSRCKRSRTAFTSRSQCCEYRSVYTLTHPSAGPEAVRRGSRSLERLSRTVAIGTVRVPVSIQISDRKIMARCARRCSRPRDDGRVFDFSMGSTFRAIGQSPTRNALVSEIRRDCKGDRGAISIAWATRAIVPNASMTCSP